MAVFTVQANGCITVTYRLVNEETMSFSIASDNGQLFTPHTTVEIADARLDAVATELALPFGGVAQRIETNDYENAS